MPCHAVPPGLCSCCPVYWQYHFPFPSWPAFLTDEPSSSLNILPQAPSGVSFPSRHILTRLCRAPTPYENPCASSMHLWSLLDPRSLKAEVVLQSHKVMHYPYCSFSTRHDLHVTMPTISFCSVSEGVKSLAVSATC